MILFFKLLYNVVLVSAIQWCESAVNIHTPPPFWAPLEPPNSIPLGCDRALRWAPCVIQKLPTSYLFYKRYCTHANATLSIHPTLFFPHHIHEPFTYVCVFITVLQIGPSVPFYYIPDRLPVGGGLFPCHLGLWMQQLIMWHFASAEWEDEREDRLSNIDSRSPGSQILEMTCHPFCCILFVKSELLGPAQIEGKEISVESEEARIPGSHCSSCLPQLHTSMFVYIFVPFLLLCLVPWNFLLLGGQSTGHYAHFVSLVSEFILSNLEISREKC